MVEKPSNNAATITLAESQIEALRNDNNTIDNRINDIDALLKNLLDARKSLIEELENDNSN